MSTPIFDSTIAQTESGPYGPGNFEEQLNWKVATVDDLQERATQALLDKGWEPNVHGILVEPTEDAPAKKKAAKKTATVPTKTATATPTKENK